MVVISLLNQENLELNNRNDKRWSEDVERRQQLPKISRDWAWPFFRGARIQNIIDQELTEKGGWQGGR